MLADTLIYGMETRAKVLQGRIQEARGISRLVHLAMIREIPDTKCMALDRDSGAGATRSYETKIVASLAEGEGPSVLLYLEAQHLQACHFGRAY